MERVSCIIGTAGHIDHGKTTLVKALTGIDTDRLAEEKKRGVSIDLGFAFLDFSSGSEAFRAAIVDVPGHERFIKNMLAGATGMDVVVFVVAADDGVMPQTLEHLDIIRLLGVRSAVFVITKADMVSPSRIDEVRKEIEGLLKGGFLEGSPVISASAVKGAGLDNIKACIRDFIVNAKRTESGSFFRLPIDRSFSIKGFGTVVTGTVASGAVSKGEDVLSFPTGARVKVRGMQSLYLEAPSVSSGQRAALNVSGVSHKDLERGFMLCCPDLSRFIDYASVGRPLYVDCLFEFLPEAAPVKNRSLVKVHHMTDESIAKVQFRGRKDALAGAGIPGRLILKKPMMMLKGDRFILRDPSRNLTIGGGTVHIPYIARELLRKLEHTVFPENASGDTGEILSNLLPVTGLGFERNSISIILNVKEKDLSASLKGASFEPLGGFVVSTERLKNLKADIATKLASFHCENPMEAGMKEDELLKSFRPALSPGVRKEMMPALFKEITEVLVKEGVLRREANVLSLSSHRPRSIGNEAVEKALLRLFSNPFAPPLMDDIKKLPFNKAEVDKTLAYLLRAGVIVKLKEGSLLSGEAVKAAKARLIGHIKEKGQIKAAEFRDLLGCGRKLAIEILEYFDKERITLRQGDMRTLR